MHRIRMVKSGGYRQQCVKYLLLLCLYCVLGLKVNSWIGRHSPPCKDTFPLQPLPHRERPNATSIQSHFAGHKTHGNTVQRNSLFHMHQSTASLWQCFLTLTFNYKRFASLVVHWDILFMQYASDKVTYLYNCESSPWMSYYIHMHLWIYESIQMHVNTHMRAYKYMHTYIHT